MSDILGPDGQPIPAPPESPEPVTGPDGYSYDQVAVAPEHSAVEDMQEPVVIEGATWREIVERSHRLDGALAETVTLEVQLLSMGLRRAIQSSNVVDHAGRELTLAGLMDENSDYGGMIGSCCIDVMALLSMQRHSGASWGMMAEILPRLMRREALTENDHSLNREVEGADGEKWLQDVREPQYISKDGGTTWINVEEQGDDDAAH